MTSEIRTRRDAKFASDHELATQYRDAKESGDTRRRNLAVQEALNRGINKEQLAEIR